MSFQTLVLSGGSVKGVGLIGALEYIDRTSGLKSIRQLYGTSSGAIVCILIALDFTPKEMFFCFQCVDFALNFEISKTNIQFLDYDRFSKSVYDIISAKFPGRDIPTLGDIFRNSGRKLFICTYNYTMNSLEILSAETHPDVSCVDAIRLSCAIPFIFGKTIFQNQLYFDGGLVCNFPLELAIRNGETNILAFNILSPAVRSTNDTLFELFLNIVFAPIEQQTKDIISEYGSQCTLVELSVEIPFTQFKVSLTQAIKCFVECYFQCRSTMARQNSRN